MGSGPEAEGSGTAPVNRPEQSNSLQLVDSIISDGAPLISHLDAEGAAYFVLGLLEVLQQKEEDGWRFTPPDQRRS